MNYYIPGKNETPLIYAVKNNKIDIVKYLVENGVLIDITDDKNKTALDYACVYKRHKCNLDVIKYLLDHGASITSCKRNALVYSIWGNIEVLKLFLEYATKEQLNYKNKTETPLYRAAYLRKYDHLKMLISHGADVNITGPHNETVLSYLCCKYRPQDTEIIKYMLDHGADVNVKNIEGYSPLMRICDVLNGGTLVFKLLMEHSAKFTETKYGRTELMCACDRNNFDIAKILIEDYKVPVNKMDKSGKTALMHINSLYIYYFNSYSSLEYYKLGYANLLELIKLLLKNGAKTYMDIAFDNSEHTKNYINKIFSDKTPDDILELL
jgi:ankyrin repeat protein